MRHSMLSRIFVPAALLSVVGLSSCGTIPSGPSGSSVSSFLSPGDIPRNVMIRSVPVAPGHDPAGKILTSELPALGFILVHENPQAVFVATVESSDYSPVELRVSLILEETHRVLWSAKIVRRWDIYASVVSASESNAKEAIQLLRRDLEKARRHK